MIVPERPVNELIFGSPKSGYGAALFGSFFRGCIEGEEPVWILVKPEMQQLAAPIKLSDSGLLDAKGRKQFRHVWQSRLIGSFHELVSRECVYCGHVDLSSQQVGSFASAERPEL